MHILLGTVFLASLLGSLHCVGMCGPFALLASSNNNADTSRHVGTIAYSFGRLVSYSIVGAIFGSLGLALNAGVSFTQWQQTATYVAGAVMIVVGGIALARCIGYPIKLPTFMQPVQILLQAGFQKTKQLPPVPRATFHWDAFQFDAMRLAVHIRNHGSRYRKPSLGSFSDGNFLGRHRSNYGSFDTWL